MTVKTFCIGTPGQNPRIFITAEESFVQLQVKDGEVYFYQSNYIPSPHVISDDGLSLIVATVPLDDLKDRKWINARQYRDTISNGQCNTPCGLVQIDDTSKLRINGAVSMAMLSKTLGQDFSIDWTLQDNSIATLNADEMILLGMAVGKFVADCQTNGTSIRNAILAATDEDSLNAIDIEAGYPS